MYPIINRKARIPSIVFASMLLAVILLTSVPVNAFVGNFLIYGPEQISTGGDEEYPQIATDSKGNAHIVWSSYGTQFLFYKMVDSNGKVLIDETNLNPCDDPADWHVRALAIAVDSEDKVHIVFHGWSLYNDFGQTGYKARMDLDSSEIIYIKINPYLDDRDGTAADVYTITEIPERIISIDDGVKSRAPNIAIDCYDRLHVVWYDGEISEGSRAEYLNYLVMDKGGAVLVSVTTLSEVDTYTYYGIPQIDTDSNGNAHIVYCTDAWDSEREIYYTMVNGTDGSTLIDDTRITDDDGHASTRPALAVDSKDKVLVVWHDRRLFDAHMGEHELFYSMLDPSLYDQNGGPADPSVISLISENMITGNDGYRSHRVNIAIDHEDMAHVVWTDQRDVDSGEIYYMALGAMMEWRITHFNGEVAPTEEWSGYAIRSADIAVTKNRIFITFQGVKEVGGLSASMEEGGRGEGGGRHGEEGVKALQEGRSCDIYLVILGPAPVGGEILPINIFELAAPYILTLAVAAGIAGILLKKRITI